MSPLEAIKYIVEFFQGTSYEPFMNALLFMLFVAFSLKVVFFLLGSRGRQFVVDTALLAANKVTNRRGYAPSWEHSRSRIQPFVEYITSLFFAFIGIYSALIVGLALILNIDEAPWWVIGISVIFMLASAFYMRINLEYASWAQHELKEKCSGAN